MPLPMRRQKLAGVGKISTHSLRRNALPQAPEFEDLARWLELNWIYPQGFEKEAVLESDTAFVVVGREQLFKLPKFNENSSKEQRLSAVVNEINSHWLLAPDSYLGICPIFWREGELIWSCVLPLPEVKALNDVWGYAIAMRRISDSQNLLSCLADGISEAEVDGLLRFLLKFYRLAVRRGSRGTEKTARAVQQLLTARYLGEHTASTLSKDGCCLTDEVLHYVESFITKNLDLFVKREARGCWVEGHAALSLDKIFIKNSQAAGNFSISIVDRATSERRYIDLLADLSALCVELEVLRYAQLSEQLESSLKKAFAAYWDEELFGFFKVAEGYRVAKTRKTADPSCDVEDYNAKALALAFGLNGPVCIFVTGSFEKQTPWLEMLRSLFAARIVSSVAADSCGLQNSRTQRKEELLNAAKERLAAGQSVVLLGGSKLSLELELFFEFLQKRKIASLLVQADEVKDEILECPSILSGSRQLLFSDDERIPTLRISPDAEHCGIALQVLNSLKSSRRSARAKKSV